MPLRLGAECDASDKSDPITVEAVGSKLEAHPQKKGVLQHLIKPVFPWHQKVATEAAAWQKLQRSATDKKI